MTQEILFKDILPYLQLWTGIVILILLISAYRIWRFGKQHPEIFQPDTTAESKDLRIRKAELRKLYNNKSMMSISVIFVWIIGVVLICYVFDFSAMDARGWFLLLFAVFAVLWVISSLQQKSKD